MNKHISHISYATDSCYLSICHFFFRERVSLSSLCWPETGYLDLVSTELTKIYWPLLELMALLIKNHCCNRVFKIWINVRNYPERPLAWYFNHPLVLCIEKKVACQSKPCSTVGHREHKWYWKSQLTYIQGLTTVPKLSRGKAAISPFAS